LAVIVWSLVCVWPFFYVLGALVGREWRNPRGGLRVSEEEEEKGADEFLHNIRDPTRWTKCTAAAA